MEQNPKYFIGVDVSKNSLNVCVLHGEQAHDFVLENSANQISDFFKIYSSGDAFVVFETTNNYTYTLMRNLEFLGIKYSMLDAFKFSHFLKHNSKIKNDKSDAQALALYASKFYKTLNNTKFNDDYARLKSYQSALNMLGKINTQLKNFNETLKDINNDSLKASIMGLIKETTEQKEKLENEIYEYVEKLIEPTSRILEDNKGFGKSLAIYLLPIIYLAPERSADELASYIGVTPKCYESGVSVRGAGHIGGGAAQVRKALFLAAMSAVRYNPVFKAKYDEMVARGKAKKVALVAVMRKIVKYIKNKYFQGV